MARDVIGNIKCICYSFYPKESWGCMSVVGGTMALPVSFLPFLTASSTRRVSQEKGGVYKSRLSLNSYCLPADHAYRLPSKNTPRQITRKENKNIDGTSWEKYVK